jgi:glycosyltransferase involved in cell wall biosynthesis
MASTLRIGLVGPDRTQPCGIADYTSRLGAALAVRCDLAFVPFRDALSDPRLEDCDAILLQYERSLVPEGFPERLSARYPGRVYAVPHEVYEEDPFAFPYASLKSAFPPLLWLKRLVYRRRHREYAREKDLQARGYGAHKVIPLSGPGGEILKALAGDKVLDPVPHAMHMPTAARTTKGWNAFFPSRPKAILGIFGFLNPGLDYGSVLDLLARLDAGVSLLVLGGPRDGGSVERWLSGEVDQRGLSARVRVTGYLPEADLDAHLRLCDVFLCPMRFKSNSGSLLHLIHLGKPILASDLPLTRYLKGLGAPLELYGGPDELRRKTEAAIAGADAAPINRYPWDFSAVADAYLRVLGGARP